jgi:ribosomal protein L7/L12
LLPLLRLKRKKRKTEFDVVLSDGWRQENAGCERVRELTGLPLKKAKRFGGQCSGTLKEAVSKKKPKW